MRDDRGEAAWACVNTVLHDVFSGDASEHLARIHVELNESTNAADRALYGIAAAIASVITCDFDRAARFATQAARDGAGVAPEIQRLSLAARAMAQAMAGQEAALPEPGEAGSLPTGGATDDLVVEGDKNPLLLRYLLAEAALSSGAFEQADALIAGAGLAAGQVARDESTTSHPADGAAVALQLLAARSAAFHGRRDAVVAIAEGFRQRASVVPPRAVTVLLAISCYGAAVTGDRQRCAALAETVLTRTRGDLNYLSVGACLYVSWAFRNTGQLQRAAALLVSAAGADLGRCKVWDRAFAGEVLIEAALARGDRYRAGALLRSTGALARYAVAASSVSRSRGAVALSSGRMSEARALAAASVRLDEDSGASTEVLRGRIIEASALSRRSPVESAELFLQVAREADATGNESLRSVAASRWRDLAAAHDDLRGDGAVLTPRQRAVGMLLAEGHSNSAIAQVLFLSVRTVQSHVEEILRLTGSRTRSQAARILGVPRTVDARGLTSRQRQVAELAAAGSRNAEIGAAIGLGEKTVERHLSAALKRLGLPSRTALASVTLQWDGPDGLPSEGTDLS